VATRDFVTFSAPYVVNTPYGPGHTVKLAQPAKNGGDAPDALYVWNSGNLGGANNDFLRFSYRRIDVTP
jgi:hypothetical protein